MVLTMLYHYEGAHFNVPAELFRWRVCLLLNAKVQLNKPRESGLIPKAKKQSFLHTRSIHFWNFGMFNTTNGSMREGIRFLIRISIARIKQKNGTYEISGSSLLKHRVSSKQ